MAPSFLASPSLGVANSSQARYIDEMPKRSSKKRTADTCIPSDEPSTSERQKNPAAVELGRLGGKKGGKARAAALTPEQRREIAKRAAAARWAKKN